LYNEKIRTRERQIGELIDELSGVYGLTLSDYPGKTMVIALIRDERRIVHEEREKGRSEIEAKEIAREKIKRALRDQFHFLKDLREREAKKEGEGD